MIRKPKIENYKKDKNKKPAQIQGLKKYNPKSRKAEMDKLRKELGIN